MNRQNVHYKNIRQYERIDDSFVSITLFHPLNFQLLPRFLPNHYNIVTHFKILWRKMV